MKISIIIPAHNAEKVIRGAIDKLFENTKKAALEVLIIENGSDDNTYEVCKELVSLHKEIKLFQCEKKGPSAARNAGLEYCTGEIIGFCDADDYFEAGSLDLIDSLFSNNSSVSMVIGSYKVIKNDGKDWLRRRKLKNDIIKDSSVFVQRLLCDARVMGSVCNKFYRRCIIEKIRFNEDIFYCEDTYFNVSVIKKNPSIEICTLRKTVYNYIKTGESATNQARNIFDGDNLKYILAMNSISSDFSLNTEEKRSVEKAIYMLAVDNFYVEGITKAQERELLHIINCGYDIHKKKLLEYTPLRNIKFWLKGRKILSKNRI